MNPLKLRETLECPVRYHLRRGDVYQCKRGHSVCGSCFAKLPAAPAQLCPLARCEYDRPARHNIMAEQIIAGGGVALDCDNADHGCGYKPCQALSRAWGRSSRSICWSAREVPFPEAGCEDRIRFSELENHLASAPDHELVQAEPAKYWFTEDMEADWGRVVQQIGGVTFYEQVVVRGGTWYAWVQVVGGAREAVNWSCDVLVETFAMKGLAVHPMDRMFEEIVETGEYLALVKQQARKLAVHPEDGGFNICVKFHIAKK